jgi:hypothetical protein
MLMHKPNRPPTNFKDTGGHLHKPAHKLFRARFVAGEEEQIGHAKNHSGQMKIDQKLQLYRPTYFLQRFDRCKGYLI